MDPLKMYFRLKMWIFHCYVSLTEGTFLYFPVGVRWLFEGPEPSSLLNTSGFFGIFWGSPRETGLQNMAWTKKNGRWGKRLVEPWSWTSSSLKGEKMSLVSIFVVWTLTGWWQLKDFVLFTPKIGEMIQFWLAHIFQMGGKLETTNYS